LYDKGYKYSTLNTARSAVSAIVVPVTNQTLGLHPLVSRFMKGIFKNNLPVPKYQTTWDVQIILNYSSGLPDIKDLDLKSLTIKLLMLIVLVSAQRGQSLHMLDISFMKVAETSYEFALPDHVKQSRQGYNTPSVVLKAYPHDMALCVVYHLKEYLKRTESLRKNETRVFISYVRPHKLVSRDTISRWIRSTMVSTGIDVSKFSPHSTRMAATSKGKAASVPMDEILQTAGWSSSRCFDRFYNKPVLDEGSFALAVLNC
jgi:hypothetical protein